MLCLCHLLTKIGQGFMRAFKAICFLEETTSLFKDIILSTTLKIVKHNVGYLLHVRHLRKVHGLPSSLERLRFYRQTIGPPLGVHCKSRRRLNHFSLKPVNFTSILSWNLFRTSPPPQIAAGHLS